MSDSEQLAVGVCGALGSKCKVCTSSKGCRPQGLWRLLLAWPQPWALPFWLACPSCLIDGGLHGHDADGAVLADDVDLQVQPLGALLRAAGGVAVAVGGGGRWHARAWRRWMWDEGGRRGRTLRPQAHLSFARQQVVVVGGGGCRCSHRTCCKQKRTAAAALHNSQPAGAPPPAPTPALHTRMCTPTTPTHPEHGLPLVQQPHNVVLAPALRLGRGNRTVESQGRPAKRHVRPMHTLHSAAN